MGIEEAVRRSMADAEFAERLGDESVLAETDLSRGELETLRRGNEAELRQLLSGET